MEDIQFSEGGVKTDIDGCYAGQWLKEQDSGRAIVEANLSTGWVYDNKLVCNGSKTKLLVVGMRELRESKLVNTNTKLSIIVA